MDCPKCDTKMIGVTYRNIQIDRCPDCQGVWLDKSELETILSQKLAGMLDVGSFKAATEEQNAEAAHCRRCDKDMMVLTGAADVRFEWCDKCDGMFFDRGELTILQEFEAD